MPTNKTLLFHKEHPTSSIGRNGTIMTTGIEISYHQYQYIGAITDIRPLTSRGNVGQCAIEIPADSCPFRALDALIEKTGPKNLPILMGIHPLLDRLVEDKLSGKE